MKTLGQCSWIFYSKFIAAFTVNKYLTSKWQHTLTVTKKSILDRTDKNKN